ncbi:hypothetical protein ACFQ3S_11020 [Mucilaginibacter terrae]|uniref:hypothetical protein n=1 Tax=Mucilaginibacter terrae TaxID=1955052 RepID=UPI0036313013
MKMNFSIDSQRINSLLHYYLPELLQWRGSDFNDEAELDESELHVVYHELKKYNNVQKKNLDLKTYLLNQVRFNYEVDELHTNIVYEELAFLFCCVAHTRYLIYQNNESAMHKDALINLLQLAIMTKAGRWKNIDINVGQTKGASTEKNILYDQPATFRNLQHFASTKALINLFANIYNISLATPELLKATDNLTSLDELIELKSTLVIADDVKQKQIYANGALMIAKYLNDHCEFRHKQGKKYSAEQLKHIYYVYSKLGWTLKIKDVKKDIDRFAKEIDRSASIKD